MEVLSSTTDVTRFSWRHLAFIAPLILLHVACALVFVVGTSSVALVAFAGTSVIQIVGITMGYHRLLAHRSFKTSRLFRFILTLFGVLAGLIGKKLFDFVWTKIDDEEPPEPTTEETTWGRVIMTAAIQGVIWPEGSWRSAIVFSGSSRISSGLVTRSYPNTPRFFVTAASPAW